MNIIRPIQRSDQKMFEDFSFDSLIGMTNLPHNREKFLEKIILSEKYFSQSIQESGEEEYYFVLEDLKTGNIGGICGIIAQSLQSFRYCYRIEAIDSHAAQAWTPKEMKVLRIISNSPNSSEICALYLHPSFRHSGQGRLLSLSRFLFIAAHRTRFRQKMIAEMRGYIDSRQVSPFWEGLGRHFCNLSFVDLMEKIENNHHFLPEILPKYPIYISLLPKEIQEAIGKTHDTTQPAYQMLMHENFIFLGEVDIFEGGPILSATTSEIRSIQSSELTAIDVTEDLLMSEPEFLIGNEKLQFRSCYGRIKKISSSHSMINISTANALQVKKGEQIRYTTLH